MHYFEDTSPSKQCDAFGSLIRSSYEFTQVERPVLPRQVFPPEITFITMLRQPIERVVSSYRMARNLYKNDPNWNMKKWLTHESIPRTLHQTSKASHNVAKSSATKTYTLPTLGLDENYMTKWFCGMWKPTPNLPKATEECYTRARIHLDHFDYVFITERLAEDLPLVASYLGYGNATEVKAYNIRMHDTSVGHNDLSAATNISKGIEGIDEFSKNDGTYELAIDKNKYDILLYTHALRRHCVTVRRLSLSECTKLFPVQSVYK